ncbi:hypothetical protein DFH11DRAFT_1878268 [Phellopilus nigrolimitatus]|nr:hypothetical protein DFH11DRAFT_1878268 [Phellopilus nigrolimitatus]
MPTKDPVSRIEYVPLNRRGTQGLPVRNPADPVSRIDSRYFFDAGHRVPPGSASFRERLSVSSTRFRICTSHSPAFHPSSSELRNQAEHAQDLPTSPRLAAIGGGPGAFWGGQVGAAGFGVTPGEQEHEPRAQPNSGPLAVAASKGQVLSQLNGAAGGFDSFSDTNPFTLKTLDAYRMQLWNRIAMQAQQQRAHAPAPNSANTSPDTSPASSSHANAKREPLRPREWAAPALLQQRVSPSPSSGSSKAPFSALLAGKGVGAYPYHGLPSPRASSARKSAARVRRASSVRSKVLTFHPRDTRFAGASAKTAKTASQNSLFWVK